VNLECEFVEFSLGGKHSRKKVSQSINQRSSQSHNRPEEKPHPSTTTGGANPASSQSEAGLGGYVSESRQH